jgi:hypothetical protein
MRSGAEAAATVIRSYQPAATLTNPSFFVMPVLGTGIHELLLRAGLTVSQHFGAPVSG